MKIRWLKSLYFWILVAFVGGALLGWVNPKLGLSMEPLGIEFIKLVKLFIGPIIFLTITTGIIETHSLKKLGKVGLKAFIYFEVISTLALLMGWGAAVLFEPGSQIHANASALNTSSIQHFIVSAEKLSFVEFLEHMIPNNIIEPFIKGDMIQILILSILFGTSLLIAGGEHLSALVKMMNQVTQGLFQVIKIIMFVAPLGVFGAMAFTVAKFGNQLLIPLLEFIVLFYMTGLLFIVLILGAVAKYSGFSLFAFIKCILPELLLVLGTSSSEAALPQLIKKLETLGCQQETVGVVVPFGYSFNLDGTNIYITLAALFIAQALGIHLTFGQQIALFATAMLSSKGAAGITGAGFITLTATLSVVPSIPAVGIVLILGIDRFMSAARAVINYIGNGVAALAISLSEKEMTKKALQQRLIASNLS